MEEKSSNSHNQYHKIPAGTRYAIARYLLHGIQPGGFLSAVLRNQLRESLMKADPDNRKHLMLLLGFLFNEAPACSHGAADSIDKWIIQQMHLRPDVREKVTAEVLPQLFEESELNELLSE